MIIVNSLVEDISKLLFLEFVLRSQIVNDVGRSVDSFVNVRMKTEDKVS